MILEEFDYSKKAVINPEMIVDKVEGMPKVAVTCFARETFSRLLSELKGEMIAESSCANMVFQIYKTNYNGVDIALFMADVGAPTCVGIIEDVFAMGVEKVVVFGTCGVLDSSIEDCSVIVPDRAVRDEGTSYHYVPASDEIDVNVGYKDLFCRMLDELGCSYRVGKVWTTDAFYRETPDKVAKRKASGCICVDMECSALAALAQFRNKDIVQFFYAADNLDKEKWDARSLSNDANLLEKDRVAMIAMNLAVLIRKNAGAFLNLGEFACGNSE